ncbi:TonB family protein [Mucilaginibacter sp. HC2]|uniref:energy transducer TonB n=1 Tax=Mucilaginibacter inviolabilis TaxID=2714892 RepID=UPI00140CBFA2|nr:energy transducer TonB [Mucilaginibacter inviolabilis]NHA07907.1 TonB family protein [Mucilaginibacter inviolabilis]
MTYKKTFLTTIAAICLLCLVFSDAFAQNNENKCEGKQDTLLHKFVYTKVDEVPEPEGGIVSLNGVIGKNLRFPPGENHYAGSTIVTFVVEPDGSIDGTRVLRDSSGDKQFFGKQVLNIVSKVKWKPGKCGDQPVACLYSIPVHFGSSE